MPRPRTLTEVFTPLEEYFGSAHDRHTLARAEDVLIRDCMRHLGLDWPVEQPRQLRMTLQAWDLGFLDADAVARYGYHPPWLQADLDVSIGGPANGARMLIGAQRAAYTGTADRSLAGRPVPPGGCAAEAQRRLDQGAPEVDGGTAITAANLTGQRALTDSRVVAVTREWSACMKRKGYRYSSPYEARSDSRWNGEDPGAAGLSLNRTGEIETAQVDMTCREEVNYLGVRLAVITAYQNREIRARQSLFAQIKEQHRQRMTNAELVLR